MLKEIEQVISSDSRCCCLCSLLIRYMPCPFAVPTIVTTLFVRDMPVFVLGSPVLLVTTKDKNVLVSCTVSVSNSGKMGLNRSSPSRGISHDKCYNGGL